MIFMLFLNFLAEGSQYVDPIVKLFGQGASWLSTIAIGSVITAQKVWTLREI